MEVSAGLLLSGLVPEPRQFVVHYLDRDVRRHDRLQLCRMPLTVFAIKGLSGTRRERIEAAVGTIASVWSAGTERYQLCQDDQRKRRL